MSCIRRVLAVALPALMSLLTVTFAVPAPASASAGGERTRSYGVDVTVARDGHLHVRERIVQDFGARARRGITRRISMITDDSTGRIAVQNVAVTSPDGAPAEVRTRKWNGSWPSLTIRVGSPRRTVTGVHTYVLSYDVTDAITNRYDHNARARPHLGWTAIGPGWRAPIDAATVRLHASGELGDVECRIGLPDPDARGCGKRAGKRDTAEYGPRTVGRGKGVIVSADLPHDVAVHVNPYDPDAGTGQGPARENHVVEWIIAGGVLLVAGIAGVIGLGVLIRRATRGGRPPGGRAYYGGSGDAVPPAPPGGGRDGAGGSW